MNLFNYDWDTMAKEIERKFLVDFEKCKDLLKQGSDCKQGYISKGAICTIRVRILGNVGYLTLKSKTIGISRDEFEYQIPIDDAEFMLNNFCGNKIVKKTRYTLKFDNLSWVVDVFYGDNEGLILAEIELENDKQKITIPDWVVAEVSGDARYFNSQLAINPYCKW